MSGAGNWLADVYLRTPLVPFSDFYVGAGDLRKAAMASKSLSAVGFIVKIDIDLWCRDVYNRVHPAVTVGGRYHVENPRGQGGQPMGARYQWPVEGVCRIPFWVYTDPEIYVREQERIFCGPSWAYVALEAEIPKAGDFKRSVIGEKPVVVVRDEGGAIHVVENRCAHRGVQFCQTHLGHASEFMCPYHQWTYTLQGDLIGVPFRRGIKGQGGMPTDFELQQHGLRKLHVATRHGVVFASFADDVEPLDQFIGLEMLKLFDRVFDGRELEVLGYSQQLIPANWKLMFENIKAMSR